MMKLTFLGTGTSTGIPEIGCSCEVCTSADPRDNRLRSSLLIEFENKTLLIDCGPDFRMQMLKHQVKSLDAVLLTHEHFDHIGGLDDIRRFKYAEGMDVYAEENVLESIRTRLYYVFRENRYPGIPNFNLHAIGTSVFEVEGIEIQPIRLMHARLPILGFRISNMAYLTDLKTIPEEEYAKLQGLDILIINALKFGTHISHQGVDEALKQVERISPRQTWFTHMSHRIGLHEDADHSLPEHVHFAYDGLELIL